MSRLKGLLNDVDAKPTACAGNNPNFAHFILDPRRV
jgi:hypothetical protein